jgi:hypothetical protein
VSELVDKLQGAYTERTVRRWLNRLIQEGVVSKSGATKAAKYVVISKKGKPIEKNVLETDVSSCFGSESLKAITKIKRPLFERHPCTYNEIWFESYYPNRSYYLSRDVREKLFQAGKRASDKDPAGTYAHQIFNRLLIDLSYNSSRLEGNTFSLLDTERLILFGDTPEGKLDEEKIMILNHKEAIRYLVENAPKISINLQVIFTLHYLLSDGLLEPKYAGKMRDHFVRITGSSYIPYEEPKKLERQLIAISDKAARINDPFEQSIFLLVQISYLQAFSDVNKRTARLCANIPLITKNLVPLSFNDVNRDEYASALIAIYELQDVRPIIDLFVFSYLRTCAAYDSTVKAIGYDAIRVRYRSQRRVAVREIIIGELTNAALKAYVQENAEKTIPEEHRKEFIQDIMEDLEQMDESRTIGMGITLDQLSRWLNLYKKS